MRVPGAALAFVLFVLLGLGEARLFERLLYADPVQFGFVLQNVDGVLHGRPVSKSWQQRWLAPLMVAGLDRATGDRLRSLQLFGSLMLWLTNIMLFAIALRRGNDALAALAFTAGFGLLHLLLLYKLEYPWDAIDIVLFLQFGWLMAHEAPAIWVLPLLLVGLFNHETVLYMPLFTLLRAAEQRRWRGALLSLLELAAIGGSIYWLRDHFYVGRPAMPEQWFEKSLPVVENHFHVEHNLKQWWWYDFREGRSFISLSLSAACAACAWDMIRGRDRSAALWTAIVLVSIVCFGYVNETRHYLLLIAFWCAYRGPLLVARDGAAC